MQESPLFVKVHDLLVWLVPITLKFPREHRFVAAQQVQHAAFELQATLLDARHGLSPSQNLRRADACVSRLRALLRLCMDWQILAPRQYEHVSSRLLEIGRLLGAWMRSVLKAEPSVVAD